PSPRSNFVDVTRVNQVDGKREELICDFLKLELDDKKDKPPQAGDVDQMGLEILSAHATGQFVTLTSEAENLEAHGNDLYYDATTRTSTITGDGEMTAAKDGNEIHAKEMKLKFEAKGIQEVTAKGPGRINMLDREKGERNLHARWRDELISGKEGIYDLLILRGEASFEDSEHGQSIQADLLKVWLEPTDRPATDKQSQQMSNSRLARQLEAVGHVSATAPDLRVRETDRLAIWFKNVAPANGQLPASLPVPSTPPAAPQTAVATAPSQPL